MYVNLCLNTCISAEKEPKTSAHERAIFLVHLVHEQDLFPWKKKRVCLLTPHSFPRHAFTDISLTLFLFVGHETKESGFAVAYSLVISDSGLETRKQHMPLWMRELVNALFWLSWLVQRNTPLTTMLCSTCLGCQGELHTENRAPVLFLWKSENRIRCMGPEKWQVAIRSERKKFIISWDAGRDSLLCVCLSSTHHRLTQIPFSANDETYESRLFLRFSVRYIRFPDLEKQSLLNRVFGGQEKTERKCCNNSLFRHE